MYAIFLAVVLAERQLNLARRVLGATAISFADPRQPRVLAVTTPRRSALETTFSKSRSTCGR